MIEGLVKAAIAALYRAAIVADDDWQAALDVAGINRFDRESSTDSRFAELFSAKVSTYDAFRAAAFPHARGAA